VAAQVTDLGLRAFCRYLRLSRIVNHRNSLKKDSKTDYFKTYFYRDRRL
jgi:hypothetical protein